MKNNQLKKRAREVLRDIPAELQDVIYRVLWEQRIQEEVIQYLETYFDYPKYEDVDFEKVSEIVAERFCFENDYDCDNSFWDNIDSLIQDVISDLYPEDDDSGELSEYEIRCIKADEWYEDYKLGDI